MPNRRSRARAGVCAALTSPGPGAYVSGELASTRCSAGHVMSEGWERKEPSLASGRNDEKATENWLFLFALHWPRCCAIPTRGPQACIKALLFTPFYWQKHWEIIWGGRVKLTSNHLKGIERSLSGVSDQKYKKSIAKQPFIILKVKWNSLMCTDRCYVGSWAPALPSCLSLCGHGASPWCTVWQMSPSASYHHPWNWE